MENLPVTFYFQVQIGTEEVAFKEVSGLHAEMELETISEGGLNTYQHQLPKQMKHGNLTLKRAQVSLDSALITWVKGILEGDFSAVIQPKNIIIKLLNANGNPAYTWTCENAFPVKWEIDTLDAEKNSILIETLEFTYRSLKRS